MDIYGVQEVEEKKNMHLESVNKPNNGYIVSCIICNVYQCVCASHSTIFSYAISIRNKLCKHSEFSEILYCWTAMSVGSKKKKKNGDRHTQHCILTTGVAARLEYIHDTPASIHQQFVFFFSFFFDFLRSIHKKRNKTKKYKVFHKKLLRYSHFSLTLHS